MLSQTAATARTAAIQTFAAQAALIKGVPYNAANLTLTVSDTATTPRVRTVNVTYTAQVSNLFGAFHNNRQTNLTITSSSSQQTAPNIDFYLLLDNSPSMELPATSAGITSRW